MKNIRNISLALLATTLAFILPSCEKNDDHTIVFNNSGSLTVKVLDENNQPCNDASLTVYGGGQMLFQDTTNTTGVFNVGKLLYGEYGYSVTAKKENRTYSDNRMFQIVAGDDKVIQINPYSYVSKVKINVIDYWTGQPVQDISIGLLPTGSFSQGTSYSFEDYIKLCYFIEVTDSNGQVIFNEVPVGSIYGRSYIAFIFTDESHWETSGNTMYVYKDETNTFTVQTMLP